MTALSMEERIARIAEPLASALGLEIWGVECIPSGRMLVRVYVDAPAGAPASAERDALREEGGTGPSIEQCALISRQLGLALDADDVFPHAYVLELSSPGLARRFFSPAQLAPYTGCKLEAELVCAQEALPGQKRLSGILRAVEEDAFILAAADAPDLRIAWASVRRARLVPDLPFSDRTKPGKKKAARGT